MSGNQARREDERAVRKDPATAVRGDMDPATSGDQRKEDGLALTIEQRLEMLRNDYTETALPVPPKTPGWHFCWLSTTNKYDSISRRVRMGYEPVRVSELQGFERLVSKEGEFEGCVSVNEMVLFKLPEDVYQAYMTELHHDAPNNEQRRLNASVANATDEKHGGLIRDVQGFDERLVTKRPTFT